jgi:two-component system sensor histidine kinase EvgS
VKGDDLKCREAGMDDYLTKPIERERLEACIQRFLRDETTLSLEDKSATLGNAADGAAGPIDLVALRLLTNGDAEFERELVQTFIASGNSTLEEIRVALTDNDVPRIKQAAHAVKGAGASMHAEGVKLAAARLESAAQPGTNQPLAELAQELGQAVERAIANLRANQR